MASSYRPLFSHSPQWVMTIHGILPPEIIDKIVDQCIDDPKALRACALVCRIFSPRARLHLNEHHLVFRLRRDDASHGLMKWIYALHDEKRNKIKQLVVDGTECDPDQSSVLVNALQHLPSLRRITFRNFHWVHNMSEDVDDAINRRAFDSITLDHVRVYNFLDLYCITQGSKKLRELKLLGVSAGSRNGDSLADWEERIVVERLTLSSPLSIYAYYSLIISMADLRSLSLEVDKDGDVSAMFFLADFFQSDDSLGLQHLSVKHLDSAMPYSKIFDFRNIKSLHIELGLTSYLVGQWFTIVRTLTATKLEDIVYRIHLDISRLECYDCDWWTRMDSSLAHPECEMALKSFTVEFRPFGNRLADAFAAMEIVQEVFKGRFPRLRAMGVDVRFVVSYSMYNPSPLA